MAKKRKESERRKYQRFQLRNGVFAALTKPGSGLGPVGKIINLSRGGTKFHYFSDKIEIELEDPLELTIVTSDHLFHLGNVSVKMVFDSSIRKDSFLMTRSRRCGVEFGALTNVQKLKLERLIQNYIAE